MRMVRRLVNLEIKVIGAFLILISGSSIGWIISEQYLNRVREIKELEMAINLFNTEITYGQTMLSEAMERTGTSINKPISRLFLDASKELNKLNGEIFSKIWVRVLEKNTNKNNLNKDDYKILIEWGQQIGTSPLKNQSELNKLTLKKLEISEEAARVVVDKKVKITRYAGVLISLLVIILFY
jgi:stage III sporulation protein AB